uniref:Uncharacterized protein n=1 Tax=Knipowitschia caucasica TaxID=637954 RepID=A0AAV2LY46_KNICA
MAWREAATVAPALHQLQQKGGPGVPILLAHSLSHWHHSPSPAGSLSLSHRTRPSWHSLVDLIELDIPACLGIVCWHENLTATATQAGGEGGFGGTHLADLRLGRLQKMGTMDHQPPIEARPVPRAED